jgi:hypothetical protein
MPYIRRMGYLLTALLAGAFLTAMAWKPVPPPQFRGVSADMVPRAVAGYVGTDQAIAPEVRTALSSADIVSRLYGSGTDQVDFMLIGGTDRTALHDPRSCLVGAGWRLEDDHTEMLPGTRVSVRACHAVGLPGAPNYDIVYLYVENGHVINRVTQIRAAMLWSALLGRKNQPVYFLRFLQPLVSDPAVATSDHSHLMKFASQMWSALSPTLIRKS